MKNSGSTRFHACATCVNFVAERTDETMKYRCARLGYETKPAYIFNCWNPKPHIEKLMSKESGDSHEQCT